MALYEPFKPDRSIQEPFDCIGGHEFFIPHISILDTKRKSRHMKREDARIEHIVKEHGIYRNFADDINEWYLPVKEVLYYQGWNDLFKASLFKHGESIFYAADKRRMVELFIKYVNFDPKEGNIKIYREFMNTFKEGMIFKLAF